jgi:tRNA-binding protein
MNPEERSNLIPFEDFQKIDIRVGTILSASPFPQARKPALQLEIDFGVYGIRYSSAQITTHYRCAELIGKQVVAVVNFPKKRIAGFISECLVLGVMEDESGVVLLVPDRQVANGLRIA